MKKLFTLIVLVAATYFAVPANAQLKFGIKGGLNITDMSLSNDVFETSNRTGFFIGPTIKFTLPIVGLASMLLRSTTSVKARSMLRQTTTLWCQQD